VKRYRLSRLDDVRQGHFLRGVLPGNYLAAGMMLFKEPGQVSHEGEAHVHAEPEAFVILQGAGEIEVDGARHPIATGDVLVIEPGEVHHLISSRDDPLVNLFLHAGEARHDEKQRQ
jgi:quercetin dioxygenase-like cupin family protein